MAKRSLNTMTNYRHRNMFGGAEIKKIYVRAGLVTLALLLAACEPGEMTNPLSSFFSEPETHVISCRWNDMGRSGNGWVLALDEKNAEVTATEFRGDITEPLQWPAHWSDNYVTIELYFPKTGATGEGKLDRRTLYMDWKWVVNDRELNDVDECFLIQEGRII